MYKRSHFLPVAIILVIALTVYWSTSYPTITWWETSEYSAAAVCLGLTGAPGSIVLTFLGWMISRFTSHHQAFLLNLSAGATAALTVVFAYLNFRKIVGLITGKKQNEFSHFENLFFIVSSGMVICSATLWEYAIMFTPYCLTALFTMFILMSVIKWWKNAEKPDSWKSLLLISLLIGVDFSVHRTNAVLVPGIIVIILIGNYRIFLSYKSYLAAFAGLFAGLSVQLLYIPMSLNNPPLNMGETNNISQWWDFISLKQYGGNFLMDVLVRKGPFWSFQVPYYLKGFAGNFFYFDRYTIVLGFVPAALGLAGLIYLFRTNRKFATALVLFFIITIFFSVIYFNLPENYFRTVYRHYLPGFMIFAVFIFLGVYFFIHMISGLSRNIRRITFSIMLALFSWISVSQFLTNYRDHNGSGNTFTADHAGNIIASIAENGIVFSYGDNHYFPELYLQIGEKSRPDIRHCNLSLLNLDWYVRQIQRNDRNFPFKGEGIDISRYEYQNWTPQVCNLPISNRIREKYSSGLDTFRLSLPSLRQNNSNLLQDIVLFDIIKNNRWERPLYFVKQGFDPALYNWMKQFLSDEGLVYQFVPDTSDEVNIPAIEKNLENFNFQGYHNSSVILDDVSRITGNEYYHMFLTVSKEKAAKGDFQSAAKYLERMKKTLPFDRLHPGEKIRDETMKIERYLKSTLLQTKDIP